MQYKAFRKLQNYSVLNLSNYLIYPLIVSSFQYMGAKTGMDALIGIKIRHTNVKTTFLISSQLSCDIVDAKSAVQLLQRVKGHFNPLPIYSPTSKWIPSHIG